MEDDSLQITHMVVPKKWMVAVIGAVMSALLTAGSTFYKYGVLAGQLEELQQHCLRRGDLDAARRAASPDQPTPQSSERQLP